LRNPQEVQLLQVRVIKQALRGNMGFTDMFKVSNALSGLLRTMEVSQLEERLAALEKSVPKKGGG
jgi:hypothetical protein